MLIMFVKTRYILFSFHQGQVLDSDCIPVSGAVIDIWYAGFDLNSPDNAKYTFPPAELLFRGNTVTDQVGK